MKKSFYLFLVLLFLSCSLFSVNLNQALLRYPGVEGIKELIAEGADINERDLNDGSTPLINAVKQALPIEIIQLFVEAGADVNAENVSERNALSYAVFHSRYNDVIAYLIAQGSTIKIDDYLFDFRIIAREGSPEIIEAYLKAGADPNKVETQKSSPLYEAIANNQSPDVVSLLLDWGADPNWHSENNSVLKKAITNIPRGKEYARLLLEAGADPNLRGRNGISIYEYAILSELDSGILQLLRQYGAEDNILDSRDFEARIKAGLIHYQDNLEIPVPSISYGEYIRLDPEIGSLLREYSLEEAEAFINSEEGRDFIGNLKKGEEIIMYAAAFCEDPEVIRLLISENLDDYSSDDGITPYLYALLFNPNDEVVDILSGMSETKNKMLQFPDLYLYFVLTYAKEERGIRMLTEAGAYLDSTFNGVNTLMLSLYGNAGSAGYLIKHGVNPYEMDGNGRSILSYSVAGWNPENAFNILKDSCVDIDSLFSPSVFVDWYDFRGTRDSVSDYDRVCVLLAEFGNKIDPERTNVYMGYSALEFLLSKPENECNPDLYTKAMETVLSGLDDINRSYLIYRGSSMRSPLLYQAIDENNLLAIKCLLEYGADPNIPLQEGYTYAPIFYTLNHISILDEDIKEIRRGMVRLLIEAGADLSITLDGGITPLSLAERANETEIALMMLAADAKPNSVVNNR